MGRKSKYMSGLVLGDLEMINDIDIIIFMNLVCIILGNHLRDANSFFIL